MTTENTVPQLPEIPDLTNWKKFAFICDGEVADIWIIPPDAERKIAVLSSEPVVVEIDSTVMIGDVYADGQFSRPQNP